MKTELEDGEIEIISEKVAKKLNSESIMEAFRERAKTEAIRAIDENCWPSAVLKIELARAIKDVMTQKREGEQILREVISLNVSEAVAAFLKENLESIVRRECDAIIRETFSDAFSKNIFDRG